MTIQGDGSWSTVTWPYPQVRIAGNYILGLAISGSSLFVYELSNNNNVWTATEVASLGAYADIEFVDVEGWGPFYVVTASKVIDGVLETTAFMRYPNGTVTSIPNSAVPEFATICNYNGQPIIGCIQSDSAPWSSLLYSSVAWGSIGGAFDFRPSEDANQTSGFIHLPAVGEGTGLVRRVLQLGKVVIAYGEDTVNALVPHSIGRTGFGRKDLEIAGVKSGNHIAGGERSHLYLNTDNELVLLGENLEEQVLGYKEFMESLTNEEIRISYVPQRKRFYISDSSTGYVLTEQGLYSCHQCVTSALLYRGSILCGFLYDNQDREPRLTTDTLDFGTRSLKTVQSIETDVRYNEDDDEVYVAVGFRSQYQSDKDSFQDSEWTRINPLGTGFPIVTANEFRVKLKGVDYEDSNMKLSRLNIRWQQHDKRNIRGLSNARQTSSRSNLG